MSDRPRRPSVVLDGPIDDDHSVNTDEALVAPYQLPEVLRFERGDAVTRPTWTERRAEMLALFEDHVFGRTPPDPVDADVAEVEHGTTLGGRATRRQRRLRLRRDDHEMTIEVLVIVPADAAGPVPAFLVPNFEGNHTVSDDTEIVESAGARRDRGVETAARGTRSSRFPIAALVQRGYGLVTYYSGDGDADVDDGFAHGPHRMFYEADQGSPGADEWGTIGAWAWTSSRVLDLLAGDDSSIDAGRVIIGGHSRLGKAALWAAAQDERFAAVFSNNSGCTGAALSRRRFGETVAVINALFPHWFCRNYATYSNREHELPVDQHQLLALVAPRPIHIGSAADDLWADPRGEFEAVRAAGAAFELLGRSGLDIDRVPRPGDVVIGDVGHHLRSGGHDINDVDWRHYLDFADHAVR